MNPSFWNNRKVFVTGHTGFKGGWLSVMLNQLGAKVKGYALASEYTNNLFDVARINDITESEINDIRDVEKLKQSIARFQPEIVIHLAAQPLVRQSYMEPLDTLSTNVQGTANLLESCRAVDSVRAVLCITSDKCYENQEWDWGYRENEPMGGHDPYSASKGCAELVISAWRRSFFQPANSAQRHVAVASARAGNVIGGGDWSRDRLLPDILHDLSEGKPILIRNPNAIRPWQHVIEPLAGYLKLCEKLLEDGQRYSNAWNFGPNDSNAVPVQTIVQLAIDHWGENASWVLDTKTHPHEAHYLKLDCSKAGNHLNWHPVWPIKESIELVVDWQKSWLAGEDMRKVCEQQIAIYTQNLPN